MAFIAFTIVVLTFLSNKSYVITDTSTEKPDLCKLEDIIAGRSSTMQCENPSTITPKKTKKKSGKKNTQETKYWTVPYFEMPVLTEHQMPSAAIPECKTKTTSTTTTTITTFLPQSPQYKMYQYINRICGYGNEHCLRIYHSNWPIMQGKWPWMAAIFEDKATHFSEVYCSGCLISRLFVLSDGDMFKGRTNEVFVVRLGDVWLRSGYEEIPHQNFKTVQIQLSPHAYRTNELALLQLNREAYFDRSVRPICLPIPKEMRSHLKGEAWVAGWGETADNAPPSPDLRDNKTRITGCRHNWRYDSICTDPVTFGKRDAGSPLMHKGGWKLQYYVLGVVDKNHLKPDGDISYYDSVVPHVNWIMNASDLSQPWQPMF